MAARLRAARSVLVAYVGSRIIVLGSLATVRHIITTRHFATSVAPFQLT